MTRLKKFGLLALILLAIGSSVMYSYDPEEYHSGYSTGDGTDSVNSDSNNSSSSGSGTESTYEPGSYSSYADAINRHDDSIGSHATLADALNDAIAHGDKFAAATISNYMTYVENGSYDSVGSESFWAGFDSYVQECESQQAELLADCEYIKNQPLSPYLSVETKNKMIADNFAEMQKKAVSILQEKDKIQNNTLKSEQEPQIAITKPEGDPVRITNGEYIQEETDITTGGQFPITVNRFYETGNKISSSIGFGWSTNLDMRIMFGIDPDAQNIADSYKKYLDNLLKQKNDFIETIKKSYHVSGIDTAKKETEVELSKINDLYERVSSHKSFAETLNSVNCPENYKTRVQTLNDTATSLYEKVSNQKTGYETILEQLPNDIAFINNLESEHKKLLPEWKKHEARAERCRELSKLNAPAMYDGTPDIYYKTGLDTFTFVDERGTPHLFVADEVNTNLFKPYSKTEHALISIEIVSTGGYVLSKKDGTNIYFTENGLLEKIVDRNKNETIFIRDDEHKITSVRTSNGEKFIVSWQDGYISKIENARDKTHFVEYKHDGKKLVAVIDTDGDETKYTYDTNDLLIVLTKSDGSKIEFHHGTQDSEERFLTTETTNEENHSEKFGYDYENKITIYTDHAGVQKIYHYDEMHKITKEIHADGTVKEFVYDKNTGLCLSEIVNGNKTNYSYDSAGNLTSATYSDGSSEFWEYDKFGFVTRHTDRDSMTESFARDGKGNLTSYTRGNKIVSSIRYNNRGLVTSVINYGAKNSVTEYLYDKYDNIISINKNGIVSEYEYDDRNRVTSFSIGGKVMSSYSYTAKTTTVTSYNGLEQLYTYNSRKDLISVRETDKITGRTRLVEYKYDRHHLPIAVYVSEGDEESRKLITEYRYDKAGKLEATLYRGDKTNPESWITVYNYIDKHGIAQQEIRSFERFKIASLENVPFTEMDIDFLKSNAGDIYTAQYEKSVTTSGTTISLTDPLGRVTSSDYDLWARPVATINALGEESNFTFSAAGRLQKEQSAHGGFYEYAYDASGNLSRAGEENALAVNTTYNADGTVASVTDRRGDVTKYDYDENARVTKVTTINGISSYTYDNLNRIVRITVSGKNTTERYVDYFYSEDGRSVTTIAGGKYITTYTLDAWGDAIKVTDGEGGTSSYNYNSQRQLSQKTDGYGNTANYYYNAIGKICKVVYPDGSTLIYEYDHLGNVTKISDAIGVYWKGSYDKAGRLINEWKRAGTENEYVYDAIDRIVAYKIGGETIESYKYENRSRDVSIRDGNGNSYTYNKDSFGRTTQEKNRIGGTQFFLYDAENALISQTDFNGNKIGIDLIGGGEQKNIRYADGTYSLFTYDAANAIITASNESVALRYEYDAGGKLVKQTDVTSGEITTYKYDRAGRRVSMQSGNREVVYTYGKNGELLSVSDILQRLSVEFEYDKMMRETKRKFANGISQSTYYDAAGRAVVIAEHDARGALLRGEGYAYGADGRRSATVNHKGEVTKYTYNNRGQLAVVHYPESDALRELQRFEAEKNGATYQQHRTVGANGFLTGDEHRELSSLMNMMQYSLGGSLPVMQTFRSEHYAYDKNGNRTSKMTPFGIIEYKYDAENRLLSSGANGRAAITYSYDANGNLLGESGSYKTASYGYNAQNRMSRSQVYDNIAGTVTTSEYAYDALGRRTLVQDEGGIAMRTVYDGLGFDIIRESPAFETGFLTDFFDSGMNYSAPRTGIANGGRYRFVGDGSAGSGSSAGGGSSASAGSSAGWDSSASADGRTRGRYADGDTHKTASSRYTGERAMLYAKGNAVAVSRAGNAAYMGTDLLGSVRSVTDGYGAVESYRDYDIFGTPYGDAATGAVSASAGTFASGVDFGYAGKPYDAVTGMYNYGFRDYVPIAARFTTLDPIRDGRNWFAYVNGDPVNYVDLWGLSAVDLKQGVNIAPSQASIIRNINNNSNLSYNSPFAIGIKIDDTAPMTGEVKSNSSSATKSNFNGYTIIGNRMGEIVCPQVNIIVELTNETNKNGATLGTLTVYWTQDRDAEIGSLGQKIFSAPVVSGNFDNAHAPNGIYNDKRQELTNTSSNPILKDSAHGGSENIMIRIDEVGNAIHQGNNNATQSTAWTESCIGITAYELNETKQGDKTITDVDRNYDAFKNSLTPYGYSGVNVNVTIKETQ